MAVETGEKTSGLKIPGRHIRGKEMLKAVVAGLLLSPLFLGESNSATFISGFFGLLVTFDTAYLMLAESGERKRNVHL